MDKVKTLVEKLDLDPCIVGDIGAYLMYRYPYLTYYYLPYFVEPTINSSLTVPWLKPRRVK